MNPHQRTHTDPPSIIKTTDPTNLVEAVSQRPATQRWTFPIYKAFKPVLGSSLFQTLAALLYTAWTLWFGVAITALLLHYIPLPSSFESYAGPNKILLFGPTALVMLISAIRVSSAVRGDFLGRQREPGVIYSFIYGAGHLGRLLITGWDRPWVYVARYFQTHISSQLSGIRAKPMLARTLSTIGVVITALLAFALIKPQSFISLLPPFVTANDAALSLALPIPLVAAIIGVVSTIGYYAQELLIGLRWLVTVLPAVVLNTIFLEDGYLIHATLSKPAVWQIDRYTSLSAENAVQNVASTQFLIVFALLFPPIVLGLICSWLPRIIENYGEASARSVILHLGEEKATHRARRLRRRQINAVATSVPIVITAFGYVILKNSLLGTVVPESFGLWAIVVIILVTWLLLTTLLRPKAFSTERINSMTVRGRGRTLFDGWSRYQSAVEAHDEEVARNKL